MNRLNYRISCGNFRIKETITILGKELKVLAIHDYYPKKYYTKVDYDIAEVREKIFRFKEGKNYLADANLLLNAIRESNIELSNTVLIAIPGSTQSRTNLRFRNLVRELSTLLGVQYGFDAISTDDREELKGDSTIQVIDYLHFHKEIYLGKRILLLDDILTSGSTFKQVASKLLATGAKEVIGIFYAKTTSTPAEGEYMIYEGMEYLYSASQSTFIPLDDYLWSLEA